MENDPLLTVATLARARTDRDPKFLQQLLRTKPTRNFIAVGGRLKSTWKEKARSKNKSMHGM